MYYPKSKIQENQYTNGSEFIDSKTGKPYQGLYHSTFDGNFYSGATHTSDSQLLKKGNTTPSNIPSSGSNLISPPLITNYEFDQITHNKFSFLRQEVIPQSYFPVLTDKDYSIGFFLRYFSKRTGGSVRDIKELSAQGFTDISSNRLYISTSFQWKITGPLHDHVIDLHNTVYGVWDTNARTVAKAESSLLGITSYLSNLIQFSKISLVI